MEINKEITVKLTPEELEKIIIDHLKSKGIDVLDIYFNIGCHSDPDDWRSEFQSTYKLNEIICKG